MKKLLLLGVAALLSLTATAATATWTFNGAGYTTSSKTLPLTDASSKGTFSISNTTNVAKYGESLAFGKKDAAWKGTITISDTDIPSSATINSIKLTCGAGKGSINFSWKVKVGTEIVICSWKSTSPATSGKIASGTCVESTVNLIGNEIVLDFTQNTGAHAFYLWQIQVDYTPEGGDIAEDPEITFKEQSVEIYKGEKYTNVIEGTHGLTYTWSSSDSEVATVDGNGRVTGVGVGTAEISATSEANPMWNSATIKYAVTVSEFEVKSYGTVKFDFTQESYGLKENPRNQTTDEYYATDGQTICHRGVMLTFKGEQVARMWSDGMRIFNTGGSKEILVSAPDGSIVTEVVLEGTKAGQAPTNVIVSKYAREGASVTHDDNGGVAICTVTVTYREAVEPDVKVSDGMLSTGFTAYSYSMDTEAPAWEATEGWTAATDAVVIPTDEGSHNVWVKMVNDTQACFTTLAYTHYNAAPGETSATYSKQGEYATGVWYVITANHAGRTMTMCRPGAEGLHAARPMPASDGVMTAYNAHFNTHAIAELYATADGHLAFKGDGHDHTGTYLTPGTQAAGARRRVAGAQPSVTAVAVAADGSHEVVIDGAKLGYDKATETFGFGDNYTTPVTLYATDSDANTGIEEVEYGTGDGVEYYNLQGIKVAKPTQGVFIRREGHKATKVVM